MSLADGPRPRVVPNPPVDEADGVRPLRSDPKDTADGLPRLDAPLPQTYIATTMGPVKSIDPYPEVVERCRPQQMHDRDDEDGEGRTVSITEMFEVFGYDAQGNIVSISINPVHVVSIWAVSPDWRWS